MKRSLSFCLARESALVVVGTCLVAGTYGLVRLAYGLFLPDIQASVSMSSAVAGYVSSGASASYCLGALAGLVLAGRPRLLVAGALTTAAAGSLGMALAPGTAVLVPAVVLASAGAGLASPAMVAVVARTLEPERVGAAQARVNSGTGPGLVAAGVLALVLPDWRVGFAVSAVLTAAAGLGVLLLDRPRTGIPPTTPPTGTPPGDRGRPALLVRPVVGAFLLGAASATVWTYGRSHLVSSGASEVGSVIAWIALGVGGTATVLTADRLGALPPTRAWALTTVVVAASVAVLAGPGPLPAAVAACAVFGWAFVAATSALIAWTADLAPDRAAEGTAAAFVALVLGQAAGSAVAGAVAEGAGLGAAFLGAAAVTVVAAASGLRSPRAPAEERAEARDAAVPR